MACGSIKIKPGELTESISIYSTNETQNDYGEESITPPVLVGTYFAKVETALSSARENFAELQEVYIERVKFTLWYFSAISPKNYITYDSKDYDIISINPISNKLMMEILAVART